MSGEGKGEFQTRLYALGDQEGQIRYAREIGDLNKVIVIDVVAILDEFRREIPYRHVEGHTYIDAVKLPEVIKKWLGEEQK